MVAYFGNQNLKKEKYISISNQKQEDEKITWQLFTRIRNKDKLSYKNVTKMAYVKSLACINIVISEFGCIYLYNLQKESAHEIPCQSYATFLL